MLPVEGKIETVSFGSDQISLDRPIRGDLEATGKAMDRVSSSAPSSNQAAGDSLLGEKDGKDG